MSKSARSVSMASPYALGETIRVLQHGGGDPTCRSIDSVWWLVQATPDGPATLALSADSGAGSVTGQAWGAGAHWVLDRLPDLIGAADDASGFEAHHELAQRGRREHPGWRIPKSHNVIGSLVPAIIEQKVTGKEAFAGYAGLVRRFGEPAPGPAAALGLFAPPDALGWRQIPSWEWLHAGIDRARSATIMRACEVAPRLAECAELPLDQAHRRLRAIPGIGEWTAAEVAQRALGDPDSPSFGDYHLAKNLTWALTGVVGDDEQARELLAPYVGHRYRAAAYITFAGGFRPRRGPRMSLPTHLPRRR